MVDGIADESYREKAYREYYERAPNKVLELLNMDHIRRSMYRDLRQNYATNLSWARSLGIGRKPAMISCLALCIPCEAKWV